MQRRRYLRAATAFATTIVAGCAGGGDGTGSGEAEVVRTNAVSMAGNQFDPRNVHVEAGASITWTNDDSTAHTVTDASDNWSFDAEVAGGEAAEFRFETSGVYDVYCRFHGSADLSGMSMKVGVGEAEIESPLGGGSNDGGGVY